MSGNYMSVWNLSTVMSDADVEYIIPDLQSQISNEFNYFWGMWCYVDFEGGGMPLIVVDDTTQQGVLGYHTFDPASDSPYALVFAQTTMDYGLPVSGVMSHEALEMLADQQIDTGQVTILDDAGDVIVLLQEVCDPVEQSSYYEAPNGNLVSNFITPQWFVPGTPGPWDVLGELAGPWTLQSGGYAIYGYGQLTFTEATAEKVQEVAQARAARLAARDVKGNPYRAAMEEKQREKASELAATNGHGGKAKTGKLRDDLIIRSHDAVAGYTGQRHPARASSRTRKRAGTPLPPPRTEVRAQLVKK